MSNIINRTLFIDWISKWSDHDIIKVVTGIRRCGKTTLLEIFRDILVQKGIPQQNIISVNFEDINTPTFRTYREAWEFIHAQMKGSGKHYIFLDEVQIVPDFERLVDGIFARKDCDVYITGSNSKFLSGDTTSSAVVRRIHERPACPHRSGHRFSGLHAIRRIPCFGVAAQEYPSAK